jgi:hypothetical protein
MIITASKSIKIRGRILDTEYIIIALKFITPDIIIALKRSFPNELKVLKIIIASNKKNFPKEFRTKI